jgi:asparagine synthase (glutamine-hydrolysing)
MCGFAGYLATKTVVGASLAEAMALQIKHRGPDSAGVWADQDAGIAVAFRRLAIVDLSEAGAQPMHSANGRYVLTFNGEIYNHVALRRELEAAGWVFGWRGHSDTETLLAAIQFWGFVATLQRLNGMFALALWDRTTRSLSLARDRMGEKPLYYGKAGSSLVFGSELKALKVHPEWNGEINRNAVALYFRHGYIPDPYSIYQNIRKLPPAHFIVLQAETAFSANPECYWQLENVATKPIRQDDDRVLLAELETRLHHAVGVRMQADVPLGAFLSGGIDSSLVVSLMQAQASAPVRSFTIGYDNSAFNEAQHARAIAKHLGTQHTELLVTGADALAVVPLLPQIYDEPFADSSQIPTYLLSRMTGQHVTVSLSGDGGDEMFCGYSRYERAHSLMKKVLPLPFALRKLLGLLLATVPWVLAQRIVNLFSVDGITLRDRMLKLADLLRHADNAGFYRGFISQFQSPEKIVLEAQEPITILQSASDWPPFADDYSRMMFLDMKTYLPGDILTKVDRASMAVSIEARVPLLDHELVEFAWQLPLHLKHRNGQTKWALRQVLMKHVPASLFERPKMGFAVPLGDWLAGPLKDWAQQLLNPKLLRQQGFLNVERVSRMWAEQQSGSRRWHAQLWTILMFQAWLAREVTNG